MSISMSVRVRQRRRIAAALILGACTAVLSAAAVYPLYATAQLWVMVAGVTLAVSLVCVAAQLRAWRTLTVYAVLGAVLALLLVPLATPDRLGAWPTAWFEACLALATGWKTLLTLELPLGTFQTVLVPAFAVTAVTQTLVLRWALRTDRVALFAVAPLFIPLVFAAAFGAGPQSNGRGDGFVAGLGALWHSSPLWPGATLIWMLAFVLGVIWTGQRSSTVRNTRGERQRGHSVPAALILSFACVLAVAIAPHATFGARTVPRDAFVPPRLIAEQSNLLSEYRLWHRGSMFSMPLFRVQSSGDLPARLRLAVLNEYDGVTFTAGESGGLFAKFPSGQPSAQQSRVTVTIESGYRESWMPAAFPLAQPPVFTGPRASELADTVFVNRSSGSALVLPAGGGLRAGDGYSAVMSATADPQLRAAPQSDAPLIARDSLPQLREWLDAQQLSSSPDGLRTAIERLRARGYLSHALTQQGEDRDWLAALSAEYGTQFLPSQSGHSEARIEQMFQQLNEQQRSVQRAQGARDDSLLVAAVGDDEQFSVAAALLARAMGYDSRVVVGVRLAAGAGADGEMRAAGVPGVPACESVCTGNTVAAWVEVRGADGVWAPFDVTPQAEHAPVSVLQGEENTQFPTPSDASRAPVADPPQGQSDLSDAQREAVSGSQWEWVLPVVRSVARALMLLLLGAVLFGGVPGVKWLRRRRRQRAKSAEARVVGAWQELCDAFADGGVSVPGGVSQTVQAAALGDAEVMRIARAVERAVFSPEGANAAVADAVWNAVLLRIAALLQNRSLWQRVRFHTALASLRVPQLSVVWRAVGRRFRGRMADDDSWN